MRFSARSHISGAVLLVLLAPLVAACGNSGGDDQGSGLKITFTPAQPSAISDVVFLRLRNVDGSLLVLDVVGRDITPPLDGLHLALGFDPDVAEAFGAANVTFLGICGRTRPDNTNLLCADNISLGTANQTGVVLFSAVPQGSNPVPETVSGEEVLATISFRAHAPGVSSIDFYVAARKAPGDSYSFVSSSSDPAGAAAVEFVPDVPGEASMEVGRAP